MSDEKWRNFRNGREWGWVPVSHEYGREEGSALDESSRHSTIPKGRQNSYRRPDGGERSMNTARGSHTGSVSDLSPNISAVATDQSPKQGV